MELIPKEDAKDDICKSCKVHETCDLSTYRTDIFWDIDDMVRGCFESDCDKKENIKNWRPSFDLRQNIQKNEI